MWLNSYEMNTLKDFNCRFGCSKVGNWPRSKTTSGVLSTLTPTVQRWFSSSKPYSRCTILLPSFCLLTCVPCCHAYYLSNWSHWLHLRRISQGWVYWGGLNLQWYIQPSGGIRLQWWWWLRWWWWWWWQWWPPEPCWAWETSSGAGTDSSPPPSRQQQHDFWKSPKGMMWLSVYNAPSFVKNMHGVIWGLQKNVELKVTT